MEVEIPDYLTFQAQEILFESLIPSERQQESPSVSPSQESDDIVQTNLLNSSEPPRAAFLSTTVPSTWLTPTFMALKPSNPNWSRAGRPRKSTAIWKGSVPDYRPDGPYCDCAKKMKQLNKLHRQKSDRERANHRKELKEKDEKISMLERILFAFASQTRH